MKSNKLIAEFMGFKKDSPNTNWYYDLKKSRYYRLNELLYDTDWNWLMPVVEECFKRYDMVEDNLSNHQFILNDALLETNIGSLYKAVVEFIKWYNIQKEDKL